MAMMCDFILAADRRNRPTGNYHWNDPGSRRDPASYPFCRQIQGYGECPTGRMMDAEEAGEPDS